MSLVNLAAAAAALPEAWRSRVVGSVDHARIKVMRLDASAYPAETHGYNEGLLVVDGQLELEVAGEPIRVGAGEIFIVPAGVPHAVRPESRGTLVLIDADHS